MILVFTAFLLVGKGERKKKRKGKRSPCGVKQLPKDMPGAVGTAALLSLVVFVAVVDLKS